MFETVMLYSIFKNIHQSATDLVINIVPTSGWFLLNTKFSDNNTERNSQPCNNKNNCVKVQKVANSSKGTRGRRDKYRRCIKLGFMSENSKTGIKEIIVKQGAGAYVRQKQGYCEL